MKQESPTNYPIVGCGNESKIGYLDSAIDGYRMSGTTTVDLFNSFIVHMSLHALLQDHGCTALLHSPGPRQSLLSI